MAEHSWTLTDSTQGIYVEQLSLDAAELNVPGASLAKHRLRGGPSDGVDVLEVDNGALRVAILPTRGMGLWKAWAGGLELGWKSPVQGPIHPAFVPLMESSGLGWLSGFDELLCRCGLESNGPPVHNESGTLVHPLHGRIANTPASRVEVFTDAEHREIRIVGETIESRLFFANLRLMTTYRLRVGESRIVIEDRVENRGARPADFELLYHINVGRPLLDAGSKLVAPVAKLVPRNDYSAGAVNEWDTYRAGEAGFAEQVYFFDMQADANGQTEVLLKNAASSAGMSVAFDRRQLPCFVQWKNTAAEADGYVTGLEPGVNFPNPRSFEKEQGRVRTLEPGAAYECRLALEAHPDAQSVQVCEQRIAKLQTAKPDIADKPLSGWTG